MKIFLLFISVFISVSLNAQKETKYYPNGQVQSTGKYKTYSIKITYGYDVVKLKKGIWEYFYENGERALTENYKVRWKKNKASGIWEYYSAQGNLLKKEYYKKGKLHKQEYYTEGTYNYTTDSFTIKSIAADTMLVTYYLKGNAFGELVANNGKGVYLYFNTAEVNVPKPIDLMADTGFALQDTALNLIENYSFENTKYRIKEDYELKNLADTFVYNWYAAAGTPDYFRSSVTKGRTGKKYCGIRLYSTTEYLEYLENHLKKPLKAGKKYCCKVFFKLNYKSGYATDAIGFKFSKKLLKFHYTSNYLPIPDIINQPKQMLTKTEEWMQLTGLYNATGGENYFTIGGFRAMGATNKTIVADYRKEEAYYFIDDVFVWEVANDSQCICNALTVPDSLKIEREAETNTTEKDTLYTVDKIFIIKNIFFDTDKAILLPNSFVALDSLANILAAYPTMQIEVSGHTDNTGKQERNVILSKERAQAVVNYLVGFGIATERLTFEGYADTQPIDTNTTAEGRQNNRRVQFKILEL